MFGENVGIYKFGKKDRSKLTAKGFIRELQNIAGARSVNRECRLFDRLQKRKVNKINFCRCEETLI
jgi:hypothetical protein